MAQSELDHHKRVESNSQSTIKPINSKMQSHVLDPSSSSQRFANRRAEKIVTLLL